MVASHAMRVAVRRLTLLATLAVLTACGDSSTGPNARAVLGTYTLSQVNGAPIPHLYFSNSAGTLTINSGNLTLREGGAFTHRAVIVSTGFMNDTQTAVWSGTFVQTGNSLTFDFTRTDGTERTYTGSIVSNGDVVYSVNDIAYRWTRQ